jgi:hypothetical protein
VLVSRLCYHTLKEEEDDFLVSSKLVMAVNCITIVAMIIIIIFYPTLKTTRVDSLEKPVGLYCFAVRPVDVLALGMVVVVVLMILGPLEKCN